jgi:hypothetical protein
MSDIKTGNLAAVRVWGAVVVAAATAVVLSDREDTVYAPNVGRRFRTSRE